MGGVVAANNPMEGMIGVSEKNKGEVGEEVERGEATEEVVRGTATEATKVEARATDATKE